ncbi:MAG TPA: hypothetical protein VN924_17660 [Bryobacteraceae bacterium]|nr:hypothetical protein [Bryobacteraceae bacterium]
MRTFAEQVEHLAANNYQMAAPAAGEQAPAGTRNESAPDAVRTKGDIVAYLKGSFAMLHRAAAAIDEHKLSEEVAVNGWEEYAPLSADRLAGAFLQSLRSNGGISAHERHRAARRPINGLTQALSITYRQIEADCRKSSVQHLDLPYNQGNQQFDGCRW